LPGKVIFWFVFGMARLAIGRAAGAMVEGGFLPIRRIVASRTLPGVMVGRFIVAVARLTIRRAGNFVVEIYLCPGGDSMAQ
jgi:hypothetical protein